MDKAFALATFLLALLGFDAPRGGWPVQAALDTHLRAVHDGARALEHRMCRAGAPLGTAGLLPERCVRATAQAQPPNMPCATPPDCASAQRAQP